jgi:hypothetical protein
MNSDSSSADYIEYSSDEDVHGDVPEGTDQTDTSDVESTAYLRAGTINGIGVDDSGTEYGTAVSRCIVVGLKVLKMTLNLLRALVR